MINQLLFTVCDVLIFQVLIYSIPYLIPLAQITLATSSFSTVALTVERYISVCWPFLCYRYEKESQNVMFFA